MTFVSGIRTLARVFGLAAAVSALSTVAEAESGFSAALKAISEGIKSHDGSEVPAPQQAAEQPQEAQPAQVAPQPQPIPMAQENAPAPFGMVKASDPEGVMATMQNAGFLTKMDTDGSGDPRITSKISGSNFSVYFYGCADNVDCTSIQFYAGYKLDTQPSLEQINQWNAENRFGRGYLTDTGSTRIEMDVNLDYEGVPSANFEDTLDIWRIVVEEFESFIGF